MSKYHAKRATVGAEVFDSRKEARRWTELQLLQRGGEIRDLRRQVKIELVGRDGALRSATGRKLSYRADFVYFDCRHGYEVIEDAKGFQTPEYKLKRAVLAAQGIIIKEV